MAHLAGKCDCGRKIHFSKKAKKGWRWTCFKCGKTWTLSSHGKPINYLQSKFPPVQKNKQSGSFRIKLLSRKIIGVVLVILLYWYLFCAAFGKIIAVLLFGFVLFGCCFLITNNVFKKYKSKFF